jgi:branched-subunit amino acid transport protein
MSTFEHVLAILGLAAVTVITRCFFFISDREWPIPPWLQEGLRHAPLAALVAIIAPSVLMDAQGQWLQDWQDARLPAAGCGGGGGVVFLAARCLGHHPQRHRGHAVPARRTGLVAAWAPLH